MVLLELVHSDNDEPVCKLSVGEHIIGRGDLLQCTDKRVSRKHAVIYVEEDSASIKSVHLNPCFYISSKGKSVSILSKEVRTSLGDGDKFALLPDQYWFKVKIVACELINGDNEHIIANGVNNHINNVLVSSSSDCLNNRTLCDTTTTTSSTFITTQVNSAPNITKEVSNTSLFPELDNIATTSPLKRNMSQSDEEDNEQNKRLKLNSDSDIEHELSTAINEATGYNEASVDNETIESKTEISTHFNENAEEGNQANVLVVNDNNRENLQVNLPHDNNLLNQNENPDINEEVLKAPSLTDNNDILNQDEIPQIKEEILKEEEIKTENSAEEEIKQEIKLEEPSGSSDPANPSTSNNDGDGSSLKQRRERCWYGSNCFRKNPVHRQEFSHPNDDDYDSDPNDDRPSCSYGAACYRKNTLHRRQYKHPNRPAARPKLPKKRKAATKKPTNNDNDTSEDDYDFEDPFIDDSEDEYLLESESNYSDSDYSSIDPSQ